MKPAPPVMRIDLDVARDGRGAASAKGASPFRPAALRSVAALSVRSHVKSRSSRPKWPYAAVFA